MSNKEKRRRKMITTLDDFIREYSKIVERGWIRTHRAGPTGIGKTLEDLLGIPENNLDEPDFGDYELKSTRLDSQSMLTMFTCSPLPRGANTYLRKKFGYSSDAYDNKEKVLHATLTASRYVSITNTGYKLTVLCADDKIWLSTPDGVEEAYWTQERLQRAFEKKYKNKFVYAKAEARGDGANEEFKFVEAYEVSGFDFHRILTLLEQGMIMIDLRIGQYHDGRTHDHGTGFRIREIDQPRLFSNIQRIV
jgi:hypothetical protein